ncbi:MAG: cupin domain-containing protein [Candidatus Dormibacteraeota bacterium]|nr:cupin domain-containing protein [Candidatus Dormibacteraeota bacterium]
MAYVGQIIVNPLSREKMVIQQTAASTNGRLLAFELILPPGGHVPASHVHPVIEERFQVLGGRMRFRRGLRHVTATSGQTVVVPPGTVHRFANGGDEEARVLVEARPALRMETLLEVTAELAREGRTLANGTPRPLEMALFLKEFEQEVRVPWVPAPVVGMFTASLTRMAERRGISLPVRRRIAA